VIRGIFTSSSAMVANYRRQAIVANNLANVSTTGFKQDLTNMQEFQNLQMVQAGLGANPASLAAGGLGLTGTGTELGEVKLDLSQGDLEETGNALDLAISGPGFFAVQTPQGTLYTRNGVFGRDAQGQLVTQDGGLVLGETGPLQIPDGDVLVEGDGTVTVDGQAIGRIRLVNFAAGERMIKQGDNYLVPENPAAAEQPADQAAINQGFLERANVDLTRTTVEMLAAMRSYEASQKMLQLQDQTLDRAVNDVGKV
jgi:flagellar basal-body rod protein FlgF